MKHTEIDHDVGVFTSTSLAKASGGLLTQPLPSAGCEVTWWFPVLFLWAEFPYNKKTPVKQALSLIVREARDRTDDGN